MWEKVKKVFAVIGAFFTIIFCTAMLLLRRRDSDERRSAGVDGRDTAVEDGITECEDRIGRCEDAVSRCEEHLHRAESILREAIRRSQERKSDTQDVADSHSNE